MTVEETQPLISHLLELRDRLLRCVFVVAVVFLGLVYFANDIYNFVASPLLSVMPSGASMIATNIATPFFTPLKLTGVVAVFISVPFLLYQVWAFIAPALYQHEKRLIYPLLFSSTVLFYLGVAFAYYVVFPLVFGFLTKTAPAGVAIATDISSYLDFVLTLFLAFGVCFEVPVAIILLCWSGVTTIDDLKKKRPYIIVASFVIGMLLTPPDIFSQTLLAIPMCLLFEVGLLFARFYRPKEDNDDTGSDTDSSENEAQQHKE
ncbi:twin-arginine translocase subunit TatC [Avibacterium volantium]|uniref:twin-arginine translocase subunit TatC n=1 Tax=Avibacterium TaxID=292486 RepID=UPI003BF8F658